MDLHSSYRKTVALAALIVLGGCSGQPRTDQELTSRAQQAVDRKLGAQAVFSLMETTVSQQIACGHAVAKDPAGRDFVYRDGRVILDDDPDFDAAAIACDTAIGGGNAAATDVNAADS